jgi:hypothetical protein
VCGENVVEHLVKLWEDQLKGYEVEEQGLRVMLDEAVVERTKSEISQDKQILTEWETLLFGKREAYNSFYKAAEQDVDAFVAVRYMLDVIINMWQATEVLHMCTVSPKYVFTLYYNTLLPCTSVRCGGKSNSKHFSENVYLFFSMFQYNSCPQGIIVIGHEVYKIITY